MLVILISASGSRNQEDLVGKQPQANCSLDLKIQGLARGHEALSSNPSSPLPPQKRFPPRLILLLYFPELLFFSHFEPRHKDKATDKRSRQRRLKINLCFRGNTKNGNLLGHLFLKTQGGRVETK
jgi:hypothetical protein